MSLNSLDILGKVIERLESSLPLANFVNDRIYNFPKQESLLPYVRASVSPIALFDTKTELGYECEIIIDVWSNYFGDKEIFQITDIIKPLFHRNEFTGMTFQSVYINFEVALL